jgi:sugar phosphate permease
MTSPPLPDLAPSAPPDPRAETLVYPSYRWIILGVLWVTYVVVFVSRLSVGPLAPFVRGDLGINNAQIGLVMSAAAFGYTLTQIPTGWFVDRIGARWPIAIGEFVAAGCMAMVAWSSTYASLLAFMLFTGMGCGLLMPATTQAVVVWFPRRERATVMGVKQTAVNMGGIIGAAALPAIAVAYGWRTGFFVVGCVAFGIGVVSLVLYRNPPAGAGEKSASGARPATTQLRSLLTNRNLWLVAGAGSCMNWVEMSIIGHFTLYAKDVLGLSAVAAGGVLAGLETAGAVCRPVSGLVSDSIFRGARRPVFVGLAAIATVLVFALAAAGPRLGSLIYPLAFALGVGAVGFGAIFFTMLSEIGGPSGAGTASAFGSTVSMVGSIVGPPVFGRIVDVASYQRGWLSLGLIGAMAVVMLVFVDESSQHDGTISGRDRRSGRVSPEPATGTPRRLA